MSLGSTRAPEWLSRLPVCRPLASGPLTTYLNNVYSNLGSKWLDVHLTSDLTGATAAVDTREVHFRFIYVHNLTHESVLPLILPTTPPNADPDPRPALASSSAPTRRKPEYEHYNPTIHVSFTIVWTQSPLTCIW